MAWAHAIRHQPKACAWAPKQSQGQATRRLHELSEQVDDEPKKRSRC